MTGRPRSRGSSRCSTDAKNASASACSTNRCSPRLLEPSEGCVEAVDLVRGVVVDETHADRAARIRELLPQPEGVPVVVRPDAEALVAEPLHGIDGIDGF